LYSSLSEQEKHELLDFLSLHDKKTYKKSSLSLANKKIREIVHFYIPLSNDEERKIWNAQKQRSKETSEESIEISKDELVEDAGLAENGYEDINTLTQQVALA